MIHYCIKILLGVPQNSEINTNNSDLYLSVDMAYIKTKPSTPYQTLSQIRNE